ncbi:MAG: DUF4434 domain-containing protein [Deltaproteobacteria bacterium]|nr:DUF4434 domain-containing protein [Deltaproteobacteria bacterium]
MGSAARAPSVRRVAVAIALLSCDETSSAPRPASDASTQDAAGPEGRDASLSADATTPDSGADADAGPVVRLRGPLQGTFLSFDSGAVTSELVPEYLDELLALGMDTVVVASSRVKSGGCAAGSFAWHPELPDKLGLLLDDAREREISVYLGLVGTAGACPSFENATNAPAAAADTGTTVAELEKAYGAHPALAGWYIPDEPGQCPSFVHGYFAGVVAAIRARSDRPIVVAPYLAGGTSTLTPFEVGERAVAFRDATGVTIQAWQDSVGADAVDLGYARQGSLGAVEDYFREISNALGREGLWADVELFNWGSPLFGGPGYGSVSAVRLEAQLRQASDDLAARRVSWLAQLHMGTVDSNHDAGSSRLAASYRALFGLGGQYLAPAGYAWETPPAASYPDAGGELTNHRTGDPRDFLHEEWVGVLGDAAFSVDLGAERPIDWVGVHALDDGASAIAIPDRLDLSCSTDGATWNLLASVPRPVASSDGEYLLANTAPLGAACRSVRVQLSNDVWTFVSEVEIASER